MKAEGAHGVPRAQKASQRRCWQGSWASPGRGGEQGPRGERRAGLQEKGSQVVWRGKQEPRVDTWLPDGWIQGRGGIKNETCCPEQWLERQPTDQQIVGSIPSQGHVACEEGNQWMCLSPPPPSLEVNGKNILG